MKLLPLLHGKSHLFLGDLTDTLTALQMKTRQSVATRENLLSFLTSLILSSDYQKHPLSHNYGKHLVKSTRMELVT
jgi:hypothetical protein